MTNPINYRNFHIYHDPKPGSLPNGKTLDWSYYHDDYDGDGDPRHGWACAYMDCVREIDEWYLEQDENALESLSIFVTYSPNHHRCPQVYQRHDARWRATISPAYELRDPRGSSLGGLIASGDGDSPAEAMEAAQRLLDQKIEEAARQALRRAAVVTRTKSSDNDTDELAKLLGL